MNLTIAHKYIRLLSGDLRNFRVKGNNYNFSCPICGDSKTNKFKSRGYILEKNGRMFYYCHKCGKPEKLSDFIKLINPTLYNDYVLESYVEKGGRTSYDNRIKNTYKSSVDLKHIGELSELHIAKKYVRSRLIPDSSHERIYYTDNFSKWVKKTFPNIDYTKYKGDKRIVMPVFDDSETLVGAIGRSLSLDEKMRYFNVKRDENDMFIFGVERVQYTKPVIVTEGSIDSLFIENSLASSCSDLGGTVKILIDKYNIKPDKFICVFDNEFRNKEIRNMVEKAISIGVSVVFWGNRFTQEKDINNIILSGKTSDDIYNFIVNNSFSGMKAELELSLLNK